MICGSALMYTMQITAKSARQELAGVRWADVADQAPTVYAVWGGGATPAQALYMVGLILPPKTAA
jgi:hypothetical protein